ncbi:MAG: peptidylprolyl isomerase, partial [Beijerinckiaceae bacterium]
PALVRVTDIQPEQVKPFDAVATELRTEMAVAAARTQLRDIHDKIEELRANAKPLSEIAQSTGLTVRTVETDRQAKDRAGQPIANVLEPEQFVRSTFASDIGVDNEAISLRDGGYVWFDVTKIDPEKERPLADVREQVIAGWRADQVAKKLAERAAEIARKVEAGEPLAAASGLEVKKVDALRREQASGDVSQAAAIQAFNLPAGKPFAAAAVGADRLVGRVTNVTVPPFANTTQEAAQMDERIRANLEGELLTEYLTKLQAELGVTRNERSLRVAIGAEQ